MTKKGAQTQERLLTTTLDLIERQGFHNTGLQQILRESGAPKGSLYFHFPGGKDQLVAVALAQGAGSIRSLLEQAFAHAPSLHEALQLVVQGLEARLRDSDFQKGCPVATVALEVGDDHPDVQQTCREAYGAWLDTIAAALTKGGWPESKARQDAAVTLSAIEGALILARVTRSVQPLQQVSRTLIMQLQQGPGEAGA